MKSKIKLAFEKCKKEKRPALITYTVAGDNTKKNSLKILNSIAKHADILELSFLHNCPIADGGQIQNSTYRSLKNGTTLKDTFKIAKKTGLNKTQSKALDAAFSAARDRSSELMAELSTEEERTALAQKELQDRDIRLKELQGRYLIAKNNLESTNEKNRKHTDEITILNNQILELRAQLTRLEAVLEDSDLLEDAHFAEQLLITTIWGCAS